MKPKPTVSMHSATAAGSRSIRAPSASSTSAEPQRLVAERLPCFATLQPAPAATNAAVVETLNVGRPPPVPAVSTSSSVRTSTGTASSRMTRARPASSPAVSPLVLSAIRKPAACASDARPAIISVSTEPAASVLRDSPEASRSIASVRIPFGISTEAVGSVRMRHPSRVGRSTSDPASAQEIPQQSLATLRQDRLGMELDTLGGQLAVPQPHHRLAGPRRAFEHVRKTGIDDERVVPAGCQRRAEAGEDTASVVLDRCGLPVHRLAAYDAAAERDRERLVPQADAKDRNRCIRQLVDCVD